MKFLLPTILGLMLLWASPAKAAEVYLGTITATSPTAQNNDNTAVPFSLPLGGKILLYCDAAVYFAFGMDNTVAASSATGVPLTAGALWDDSTSIRFRFLSILPQAAGTANCKVWLVTSR